MVAFGFEPLLVGHVAVGRGGRSRGVRTAAARLPSSASCGSARAGRARARGNRVRARRRCRGRGPTRRRRAAGTATRRARSTRASATSGSVTSVTAPRTMSRVIDGDEHVARRGPRRDVADRGFVATPEVVDRERAICRHREVADRLRTPPVARCARTPAWVSGAGSCRRTAACVRAADRRTAPAASRLRGSAPRP